jgi:N-methylhydantoinase A
MGYRIGIDVGGTFTDFVLVDGAGEVTLCKVATTPEDESLGVMAGLGELALGERRTVGGLLGETDLIVHGTTTADNTMIQMSGAVTGLVTTEGHRDQIEIRRGFKESIWDPAYPPPVPIAPRRRRLGIPERLDFRGQVVRPLDEAAVRAAAARLRKQDVRSIAVCFLFSYLNPAHERRAREILAEECPGVRVALSHEVMPAAPEFERTSTTLVDAYVGPRVATYLGNLVARLREAGFARELCIMQSSGGVMTAEAAGRRAVATLGSGPTGGVVAATAVAKQAGAPHFIAVDMGGTSYEVCLVQDGAPKRKHAWNWFQRYLVGLPMIEMHSIGAGGGSIAYVEAGALKVGPRSAGAQPGPVCYGRGGTEPTVTDANVVLGYLNPTALCGGALKLQQAGVREAILERVGQPLGLDLTAAADGIFRIVNANMVSAIRRVSSQAGLDPRDFQMVVYGGNGPVHAGKQAEELGVRKLIVPKTSPAFSALGLLLADYVVDGQRAYIAPASRADLSAIGGIYDALYEQAAAELGAAGFERSSLRISRSLGLCYPGQTFDLAVPLTEISAAGLARAVTEFHDRHEKLRTFAVRDEEPVIRVVRLQTVAALSKPPLPGCAAASGSLDRALAGRRKVYFDGRFVDTPIYSGDRLGAGDRLEGPAVIEEKLTTLVLYPGHRAELTERGEYVVTL